MNMNFLTTYLLIKIKIIKSLLFIIILSIFNKKTEVIF